MHQKKKKKCRNIGSKLSQNDEIYRTKKLNELQTQEAQTKLYTKVHCTIHEKKKFEVDWGNDSSWRVKNNGRLLVRNNANQETVE